MNNSRQPLLGKGEGVPCVEQMRKPGNQGIESPHDPARASWRCAALRTFKQGECWTWVGSRVVVFQEVGTNSSGSLGLIGPSAKKSLLAPGLGT